MKLPGVLLAVMACVDARPPHLLAPRQDVEELGSSPATPCGLVDVAVAPRAPDAAAEKPWWDIRVDSDGEPTTQNSDSHSLASRPNARRDGESPASSEPDDKENVRVFFVQTQRSLTPEDAAEVKKQLEELATPGTLETLGQTTSAADGGKGTADVEKGTRYRFQAPQAAVDKIKGDKRIVYVFDDSPVSGGNGWAPLKPDAESLATKPKFRLDYGGLAVDTAALTPTKLLSQPPSLRDVDPRLMPGYAELESAGKGITVYVLDTGANPDHDEYTQAPGTKRWIFDPDDVEQQKKDELGHGTCTLSLINGPSFGTAKNADVVVAKLGRVKTTMRFDNYGLWSALKSVREDIKAKNLQGKAVVSMSISSNWVDAKLTKRLAQIRYKPGLADQAAVIRRLLQEILDLDVPVVASSGNSRKVEDRVDAFPAALSRETYIISVGAVDDTGGNRTAYSQGTIEELTVSAPGRQACAWLGGKDTYKVAQGTSVAVPQVAGMIATWLSSKRYRSRLQVPGKVAANVKAMVRELAYVRPGPAPGSGGGYPVAYNGVSAFACEGEGGACTIVPRSEADETSAEGIKEDLELL